MSLQTPYILYQGKFASVHQEATITANRRPDSLLAECVREADAHCQEMYDIRREALILLVEADGNYHEAWNAAYARATGAAE